MFSYIGVEHVNGFCLGSSQQGETCNQQSNPNKSYDFMLIRYELI